MKSAGLAWGLVLFMFVGGIYSIWVDHAWMGGAIWICAAVFLFPPLHDFVFDHFEIEISQMLSLLVFVLGFLGGLFLM